ncbi:hypothetical protein Nepgr_028953 [Nepenthes gracilis]|uniref:Uncharacterized protein n=1 Tax=Nepenthes gracilis TaxID=150966 RepID=A0AAD3TBH3_NEPGR|nr:hypothetical protein Nepgr_028953 [Nepenthes gracilis]
MAQVILPVSAPPSIASVSPLSSPAKSGSNPIVASLPLASNPFPPLSAGVQLSPSGPDAVFLANARDADPLGIRSRVGTKVSSPLAPSGGRVGSVVHGNSVVDGPERLLNDDDPPGNANVVKPSDLSLSWSRVVQDFPGHSTKIPSSPKEVVKANSATMATSNSFEILSEEDDLSRLGKSATQLGLISEEEGLVGPELQDACGARSELASPGPSHYNASIEESGNYKDSSTSQMSQGCHDVSGCIVDVHNDLELPSLCVNDDNCLTLPPDNPICKEDLPMSSASIESFSVGQCSNELEGGPPGRSTRSRKSKRPAVRSSSSGRSIPISSMAREIQEQTKKINDFLKNSKGPKSSTSPPSLSNG